MLGDEIEIDSKITLDESGDEQVIFQKEEIVNSEDVDAFFQNIKDINKETDEKAKENPPAANNDNVFGNLG
jgi:hypothetical protein